MGGTSALLIFAFACACLGEQAYHEHLPVTSHTMFPKGFKFGAATAAHQVEGGWNADGKGPSIWDKIEHDRPDFIANRQNGDIADDSYHLYKKDVQILKNIGFQMYRFSISWPRILPKGTIDEVNQAGIDYYMNLIDELLENGIEPFVTIFHWDLPQALQESGGWLDPKIADLFVAYAELVFTLYGEKVKYWVTINEPLSIVRGYGAVAHAPALNMTGVGDYIAGRNVLLAHAKAYRLYKRNFAHLGGKLGIAFCGDNCYPLTNSTEDIAAAERCFHFTYGWFAHPIFIGDYPPMMRETIDRNSKAEGRKASRLPYFTEEEIAEIKGSIDYFGLNYYSPYIARNGLEGPTPSRRRDMGVVQSFAPDWVNSSVTSWLRNVPQGFRQLANKVKDEYGNPTVLITENGISDDGSTLNDLARIHYYEEHFAELRRAIYEDGCNIIGHNSWSLLDNFEWREGYTKRFGLVSVDYNSPSRTRTWKKSAHWFQHYIAMHKLLQ